MVVQPHFPAIPPTVPSKRYAVVFADIAGSTRLYATVGDDVAKTLVLAIQAEIARVVHRTGGFVQEIVGDEVMFRFDDVNPAVACACEIQRAVESLPAPRGVKIAIRIGVHFGPAILEEGRMFGDTVNVAARMAGIAQAGQIITTGEVINNLTQMTNAMARRFDEVRIRGKHQTLPVYEVLWQQSNVAAISRIASPISEPPSVLALEHGQLSYRLQPQQGIFTIGRNTSSDLVVTAGSASRRHALIEFTRGRFVLTDTSTNGTYVQAQDGACVFYRRETTLLLGSGQIGLSTPPSAGAEHVIGFSCR